MIGSAQNLLLGTITLAVCLAWNIFAKGYLKQLSVLAGLVVGYIAAICMGKVDLSIIFSEGLVSLPKLLPYKPEFHAGAIFSVAIIFMVSAAETIGDTTAMVSGGLNREIGLWAIFPEVIQSVFSANVVAVVFVVSILLNLILPKNMEVDKLD